MAALVMCVALACGTDDTRVAEGARSTPPPPPPLRVSMEALHAAGGVPFDWKLTPAPGDVARGRTVFAAYGCPSCHAVQGESFPDQGTSAGPELTGMGAHHPPGYFVETIVNPNAIVVDGDGYAGANGLSTMPAYPEMSLVDLTDVVAYLSSLTTGHNHAMMMAAERAAPPTQGEQIHLVMRYDVLPGQLTAFEAWFRDHGRAQFFAAAGLTGIETYVTSGTGGPALVSAFTFRDQQAAEAFLADPDTKVLGDTWDSFIGPHGHVLSLLPPVSRVESLSGRPEPR
jgi:hypothetical protein